ncbi:MAG: hypothetical protein AB1756_04105 [Acidobacteriota bacterium]
MMTLRMDTLKGSLRGHLLFLLATAAFSLLFAATPPERINYQGVLRDSSDKPISGSKTMVFRLYDDPSAGTLLWEETYDSATYSPQITVTDGLFTAALGDSAHKSAGSLTNFGDVFKSYADVYLAVKVEADAEMTPRIKVISAGYALNANHLDGTDATQFLRSDTSDSFTSGTLTIDAATTLDVNGALQMDGSVTKSTTALVTNFNADLLDGNDSSFFLSTSSTAQTKTGKLTVNAAAGNYGVEAYGPVAGGYFKDYSQSGYSYVGYGDWGIQAYGNTTGGYFKDADNSGYAYVGYGDEGIRALGSLRGGYFEDIDESGYAWVGTGNYGIAAYGSYGGGYFQDSNSSGYAYIAVMDEGIQGYGNYSGGYFKDSDNDGYSKVGVGNDGIHAYGTNMGGYFTDTNNTGLAYVGYVDRGIWAKGTFAGGTFSHPDDVTHWADVSTLTRKIYGTGTVSFVQNHPYDKSKVIAYAAPEGDEVAVYTRGTARLINGEGIVKLGESFSWVANPDIGLTAHLTPRDPDTDIYVESLSTNELLVRANAGSRPDASFDYIVYGLRIGFEELPVVQGKEREAFLPAAEAVQESYAQSPELRSFNALERFKRMRRDNGETEEIDLSRSRALAAAIDENKQAILEKAREQMELEKKQHDRRQELNQEPHPGIDEKPDAEADQEQNPEISPGSLSEAFKGKQPQGSSAPDPGLSGRTEERVTGTIPVDDEGNIHAKSFRSSSTDLTRNLPVSEPVEAGDVLVVDPLNPQMMKGGDRASDPGVVGIVAGEPGMVLGQDQSDTQAERRMVAVALSGIVLCRVDAGYGAIQIGDLLTTSTTKGHAMKSPDHAAGTIIGKALEPLEAGTGLIKVVVMMR